IQVLIELARKVAISRLARRRTARRLAFDVIEVARPVIEGSCALNFTSRFQWLQSMPVIDGLKAIACIRSSGQGWASVPVIALTADAMSGDRERLIGLGRSGYASKPINRDDLFAEINRVLSLSRPEGLAPASFKPPSSSWIST
ncbi:MAG: response regulator, partial [Hyphomonadaceae bacterium]